MDANNLIHGDTIISGSATHLLHNGHKAFDFLQQPNQVMIAEYALDMIKAGLVSDDMSAESTYHSEFKPK
jgi:hypothetical protein